jgi:CRISPR-associated exonuclease Cas4
MFTEDDLLPISALQHLEFCPRRCALIHVEGMWKENALTAEGRVLHERVHQASAEIVAGVRTARGLWLNSRELGLFGIADLVEFHPLADDVPGGAVLPNAAGRWLPFPVEYKRGKRKAERSYFVQLCAQALCLEEMLKTEIPAGALYHGQSRRRQQVAFDAELRRHTRDLAGRLHELIASGRPPPPEYGPKCKFCSLLPQCEPKLPRSRSARDYVDASVREALGDP